MKYLLTLTLLAIFLGSCQDKAAPTISTPTNPPAENFDGENSDEQAIAIADKVMEAMGGRKAYDDTRYLSWNFFGSRKHWWDKTTGDIRIESQKDDFKLIMNIHDLTGKVLMDGAELTHPDSLTKYLQRGKDMWINDSYWLLMPYKLKDSGVTLKYVGAEKTDSTDYDVLSLEFKDVGKTPENKYHVYVDKKTDLVDQWSFFTTAQDSAARFTTPWVDYVEHGGILLSGDRGNYKLTEISVEPFAETLLTEL